ncbi:helix-turn-helix transcriptional regulator [Maribacter sp.]|nr:helix-turn-helix transcriptional regulator [Maribacter sp.]
MFRISIFFIVLCYGGHFYAQTAISGYVNLEDSTEASKEIYLTKIALEDIPDYNKAKKIASSSIAADGFFKFQKELISDTDAIYRLSFDVEGNKANDSLNVDHLFMLSSRDSIHFKKSKTALTQYTTSNIGDKEWQRLRQFERRMRDGQFKKEDSLSDAYVSSLKTYAKDSLQILMVKLIGIKQLDTKKLLERDITKNPEYYIALLAELKGSDIEREDYLFLENKLAFLTTEAAESKYATSAIINVFFGLAIMGLLLLVFRRRSKSRAFAISDLSKQERNVQGLILAGKSNKEIANELFISLSTVKTHITNIYGKLQVSSRKELLQKTQNS